jgi:hypothetical protein
MATPDQPPLPFDGQERKQHGMDTAAEAVPTWLDMAHAAVRHLAATGNCFTSEDVTALVGLPRGQIGQHRNNAVGAVMAQAARAGIIRRHGYQQSRRPVSHAAVLSVWQGTGQGNHGGVA